MKSKDRERWAKIRAKGKLRFVLVYGILCWGSATAVFSSIIKAILDENLSVQTFISFNFLVILLTSLLAGYFFGPIMWKINETSYLNR